MLEKDNRIVREAVGFTVGFAVGLAAYELANNEELRSKVAKTAKGIFNSGARRFNSFLNTGKAVGLIQPHSQETVVNSEPIKAANNGESHQERQERLNFYRDRLNIGSKSRQEPLIVTAPPQEVIHREPETREPVVISIPRRTFGVPRLLGVAGGIALLAAAGMGFLQIEDKANIQELKANTPPEKIQGDNARTKGEAEAVLPPKPETGVNNLVPMFNITAAQPSLAEEQARVDAIYKYGSIQKSFPEPDPVMVGVFGNGGISSLDGIAQHALATEHYGFTDDSNSPSGRENFFAKFWGEYSSDPNGNFLIDAYGKVARAMNPGKFWGFRNKDGRVDYAVPHVGGTEFPKNASALFADALNGR